LWDDDLGEYELVEYFKNGEQAGHVYSRAELLEIRDLLNETFPAEPPLLDDILAGGGQ
jgi:hypothetical protein